MDDSQSSYAFSNSPSIISCSSSSVIINANDAMSYDSLLLNTKASLSNSAQINDVSFSRHFSGLLEDCRLCISQSLDFVVKLLLHAETQLSKLTEYMEDSVCLLHLLSSLIKNMVESISLSCSSFSTFPTTTGRILMLVFTHCKNSETTYGLHLSNVQKQLKDLFRTCHELQLTYLMVLEKQFLFDLTEGEELDILIEALNINLKIGEVVQSLDVKTMAEQWKAYTALCEKYSSSLLDKQTYQDCAQLLCDMIRYNLKNALELDQDEKIVIRSLKVTNFMIKISLKISNTFKHAAVKDYAPVLDLLIFVFVHNPAFLEFIEGRPLQFINGILTNVSNPLDLLLKELVMDEKFLNVVLAFNIKELNDEKLLGYICLIVGIIKCSLQKSEAMPSFPKHKLLNCLLRALSHCQIWVNMGLRFQNESIKSEQTFGLFEHMLIYAASLAATMNCEEMYHLEKTMFETVLGTDTVSAMFISNLWAVVARIGNNRLMLLSQVVSLCQIYQKLENHKIFLYSPQKLHITHTMCALFQVMRIEDRKKIFEQFNPLDSRNATIWSVLKIKNLNKDLQRNIQDNFLEQYRKLSTRDPSEQLIDELIKIMKLASTFAYPSTDDMDECLMQAWMRACPRNYTFISSSLDSGTLWYFEYTEALVLWTFAMHNSFYDNTQNLTKILHVISSMIKISNSEFNLLLIDLLCKLATFTLHGQNKHTAASLASQSFRMLALDDNSIVRNKFFSVVSTCHNKRLEQIMHSALGREFQEAWNDYVKFKTVKDYKPQKLKEILLVSDDFEFSHKCIETRLDNENNSETVDQLPRTCSSNFDFADLDTLFDHESNAEPASKKMKLESSEAESILKRLEAETSILCNLEENIFTSEHKRRIQDVCEKLKRIVTR